MKIVLLLLLVVLILFVICSLKLAKDCDNIDLK